MWRTLAFWLRELGVLCGAPGEIAVRILSRTRRVRARAMLLQVERLVRCLVLEAAIRVAATLAPPAPRPSPSSPSAAAPAAPPPAGPGPSGPPPASPTDPSAWSIGFSWTAPDLEAERRRPKIRKGPPPRVIVLADPLPSIFRRKPVPPPPPPPPARSAAGGAFTGRFGPAAPMNWPPLALHAKPFDAGWLAQAGSGAGVDAPPEPDLRLAARFEIVRRIAANPLPHIQRLARRYARAGEAERYHLVYQPSLLRKANTHLRENAEEGRVVLIGAARAHPAGLPRPPAPHGGRRIDPG